MSKKNPHNKRKARERNILRGKDVKRDGGSNDTFRDRLTILILGWGRFKRILLVGFATLMLVLAIGIVFYAIDNRFVIPEDGVTITFTLYIPVIVSTIVGLLWYILGWIYIVSVYSFDESAPNVILWYLGITTIACLLNFAWSINVISVLGS